MSKPKNRKIKMSESEEQEFNKRYDIQTHKGIFLSLLKGSLEAIALDAKRINFDQEFSRLEDRKNESIFVATYFDIIINETDLCVAYQVQVPNYYLDEPFLQERRPLEPLAKELYKVLKAFEKFLIQNPQTSWKHTLSVFFMEKDRNLDDKLYPFPLFHRSKKFCAEFEKNQYILIELRKYK